MHLYSYIQVYICTLINQVFFERCFEFHERPTIKYLHYLWQAFYILVIEAEPDFFSSHTSKIYLTQQFVRRLELQKKKQIARVYIYIKDRNA